MRTALFNKQQGWCDENSRNRQNHIKHDIATNSKTWIFAICFPDVPGGFEEVNRATYILKEQSGCHGEDEMK